MAGWSSGKDLSELKASLETIRATANDLITKIDVNGVESGVGDLMDSRFQVLQLTHALVNGDTLFL